MAGTDEALKVVPPQAMPVVVDIGKKKRKQIRELRRGKGKLLDDVKQIVEDLQAEGTIQKNAQTVVLVVREKRRRTRGLFGR